MLYLKFELNDLVKLHAFAGQGQQTSAVTLFSNIHLHLHRDLHHCECCLKDSISEGSRHSFCAGRWSTHTMTLTAFLKMMFKWHHSKSHNHRLFLQMQMNGKPVALNSRNNDSIFYLHLIAVTHKKMI